MSEKQTYIGTHEQGINLFDFTPGTKKEITGRSGAKLSAQFTPDQVSIEGVRLLCAFSAIVREGGMTFHVSNQDEQGNKHPDIYPAQLVRHTIDYFAEQGNPVEEIETYWAEPVDGEESTNYTQYQESLARIRTKRQKKRLPRWLQKPIRDKHRKTAAKQTWTGELVESMDYVIASVTEQEASDTRHKAVIARFIKKS